MGNTKTDEMDDVEDFLGGLTRKEFYTRLNFNRTHIGHK